MTAINHQVLLRDRPMGEPAEHHFNLAEKPVPAAGPGQVLRRTLWLSLDPYMRARMAAGKSYTAGLELGDVMCGGTVSQVVESSNPAFAAGDLVLGYDGWQEYGLSDGADLTRLPAGPFPPSYYLGVLGMPGMTAYVGLLDIGQPRPGENVVVSAATGAVGSAVAQIAKKVVGCRVVGLAGSDEKCRYATEELGLDACINYKTQHVLRNFRKLLPEGIDVYFDNVGGPILEAVLRHTRTHARIPLCGMISQYNATELPTGPNLVPVLFSRIKLQGFIVGDHADRREEFLADMARWLAEGKIKVRESVVEGLANAPKAFAGLFRGENFGKLLVKVAEAK